jgi:hypothetical protein
MTNAAIEAGQPTPRVTERIPSATTRQSADLYVAHLTALFVDMFRVGAEVVSLTFERKPTPDDSTAANLRVTGTPQQLRMFKDVFPLASASYQGFMEAGLHDRPLEICMDDFFRLQAERRGMHISEKAS